MIVGLTGGIGSGKSTVARMFEAHGVPVYYSDKEGKRLMVESESLRQAIIGLFGDKAYDTDGLNTRFIANLVFNDTSLLQQLNGLVHPAVREDFKKWTDRQQAPYVIQESALIFEHDMQGAYDHVIVVHAPAEERINRVVARDGVDAQGVKDRMAHQIDVDAALKEAQSSIANIDLETTREQVREIHTQLLAKAHKT
ncbi:MAG: dephospho-CoA kinase [Flavobacteriaceae bacterium]|nr:dephospho-CoA kinase [Flavobacteriaceae bacterium]